MSAWGRPCFCPRKPLTELFGDIKVELKSGPVGQEAELAASRGKGISSLGPGGRDVDRD